MTMNVSYHDETPEQRETRWKRFLALTNEEIKAAAESDPDWEGIDLTMREGWRIRHPDGSILVSIKVNPKHARYLEDRHVDYQHLIDGMIKEYIERQESHRP